MKSANPLSRLLNSGWHKTDRREHGVSNLVYGQLIPFVEFRAWPLMRGEEVVPRGVKQFFDPRTATLTTFFDQQDNRSGQWLRTRSQTWLTAEGLLVQTVDFLEVPDCGAQYAFSLSEPSPDYLNAKVPLVMPRAVLLQAERSGSLARYSSSWQQGDAKGFSLVGGGSVERVKTLLERKPRCDEMIQISDLCRAGETVWRILTVQDNREGGDPAARCDILLERIEEEGIAGLREIHCHEWEAYFGTSRVEFPDPSAQFLYEVSRYVLKANLHPCGFLPIGNLPYQWQGAMFWDASFAHQAFLGCGNLDDAERIGRHLLSLAPHGLSLAQKLGGEGIRLEWTVNLFDFTTYEPPCLQIHNNAVWARCFFLYANHRGEPPGPEELEFAKNLLVFVADRLQRDFENGSPLIGIDESHADPKENDTWSIAVTLCALEDYEDCCRRWNLPLDFANLPAIRGRLQALLEANTDSAGVLQSFTGGAIPHWGSLVFDLYPDSPAALPTLALMSRNHDMETNRFNFHGLNRYAERAFPWANNWVARCLGRMANPHAHHYWLNNTDSINSFGGVPERVFYNGENYIDWCMTGHASQLWAMNAMLADHRGGVLTLLGGIDLELWPSLAFEGIHAGGGVAVSLKLQTGTLEMLEIQNLGTGDLDWMLRVPQLGLEYPIHLAPGFNRIVGSGVSEQVCSESTSG